MYLSRELFSRVCPVAALFLYRRALYVTKVVRVIALLLESAVATLLEVALF